MLRILGWLSMLLGPVVVVAASAPARYTVEVPAALDHLAITACFDRQGSLPLTAASPQAARLIEDVRGVGAARAVRRGQRIRFDPAGSAGCLRYRVDLAAAPETGHWRRAFVRAHEAVLISPDLLLWLPDQATDVVVEFRLADGLRVSTPWQAIDGRAAPRYRTGARAPGRGGKIALGRLETHRLVRDDALIELALLHGSPPVDRALVLRWVQANIDAVTAVFGRFPVPRVQILVVPIGQGGEPVPWGQVARGGGDAIHLYIDQRASAQAFLDDWVLSHELSHLFHPFLAGDARWVFEGLASYYQNVSRARVGLLTPRQAWEELHAGFERGRFGTRAGRTLSEATENMLVEQAFMQVYWSGAAIFLMADLALRERAQTPTSLDAVLAAFADCCLPSDWLWSEQAFLEKLDRLSGSNIFTRLAALYRDSHRFPDLQAAYRTLGLQRRSTTRLGFAEGPAQRRLRDAIMGPP